MIKTTLLDFWGFLKKPTDIPWKLSFWKKLQVIFLFLGLELLVLHFLLIPLDDLLDYFVKVRDIKDYKIDSLWMSLFFGLIFAPISEEIMFRFWLKRRIVGQKFWQKAFPYLVYISSIFFGLIHITNYENDETEFYILAPLIVASQMIGGFVLAFIRVKFNLFWAIFYHFLWNSFVAIMALYSDYTAEPFRDKTPCYDMTITEQEFLYPNQKPSLKIDSSNGKIYKIEAEHYTLQHLLDTLYQKKNHIINDSFIQLKLNSQKGLTKSELLEILKREYEIEPNERK